MTYICFKLKTYFLSLPNSNLYGQPLTFYYNKAYKEQHDGDSHELNTPHAAILRKRLRKRMYFKTSLNCQLLLPLQTPNYNPTLQTDRDVTDRGKTCTGHLPDTCPVTFHRHKVQHKKQQFPSGIHLYTMKHSSINDSSMIIY